MQTVQTYSHDLDAPIAIRMEPAAFAQSITRKLLDQNFSQTTGEYSAFAPNQDRAPAIRHTN